MMPDLWQEVVAANPGKNIRELVAIHEREANARPPRDGAVLERAVSMASRAMYTLHLQRRRLRTDEPEDQEFIFRFWADLEFFLLTLWHLRSSALLAQRVTVTRDQLRAATDLFDADLPDLRTMRNVIDHLEDYGMDLGRNAEISRRQLQVSAWDDTTLHWLGAELDVDHALAVAARLYKAIRTARDTHARDGSQS